MKVTHNRIAAEAGVSRTAVSYALNGTGRLEPATRDRILTIARALGYRPNLLVKGIQTGRTQTVGVLIRPDSEFFGKMLTGVQDGLSAADYVPIAVSVEAANELAQMHRLIDRRVDGLIVRPLTHAPSDAYLQEAWQRGIPLVTVDTEVPETQHADFAGTDDRLGGQLAAEHLLGLGHRRLGLLARPGKQLTPRARRTGFEHTVCRRSNCDLKIACIEARETAGAVIEELISGSERPTAVFSVDDRFAFKVYQVAACLGLRVPEDLSVVGFADVQAASVVAPPLTTVRQDPYKIGQAAAQLLLERLEGDTPAADPIQRRLVPELIIRGSTAKRPEPC